MNVEDRMRAWRALGRQIRATKCATCFHSYAEHNDGVTRCWHPRVVKLSADKPCRCKKFIDPGDTLFADGTVRHVETIIPTL